MFLSWPNLALDTKFLDPMTFGGFWKMITHKQDSCFTGIDKVKDQHMNTSKYQVHKRDETIRNSMIISVE